MDQDREQDVISRIKNGEREAFAILVDAYKGVIFNLAFRMTGNYQDADDLAQETFLRAFRNLHRYDGRKKFFTWIYTISINLIRNHLKKKGRRLAEEVFECTSSEMASAEDAGVEGDLIRAQETGRLDMCLQRLPIDLREAIVMRYYQGLSFDEIAVISGGSVSAIKMRVYRGLERLRTLMEEADAS